MTRRPGSTSLVLGLLMVCAAPAAAQTCLGAPSFRDNPYQVAIEAAFNGDLTSVGGVFAGGNETLFAGAGVSVLSVNDTDVNATGVTAYAGAELQADQRGEFMICPVAQLDFSAGPDIGPIDTSLTTIRAGASLGVIASENGSLMVVPTFGLGALFQRASFEVGGVDESVTDSGGLITAGVGLIFNRNVAVTPQLLVPFGISGSDAVFAIRLSIAFGR